MLLHQGAAAFTLWTGQPAPLDVMQAALAEARAGGLRSAEGEPRRRADRRAAVRPADGPTRHDGRTDDRFRFLTAGEIARADAGRRRSRACRPASP